MELIERPGIDGPLGMFSAMHTLDSLACELAGNQRPRAAASQVTNAAKLPDPAAPGPAEPPLVRIDPAQQADEKQPGRAADAQVRRSGQARGPPAPHRADV